jgi:hypothetical protein
MDDLSARLKNRPRRFVLAVACILFPAKVEKHLRLTRWKRVGRKY